jgi:hypothetical protein
MDYNEAVKYIEQHKITQRDLDSQCDYDKPLTISRDYVLAQEIVREQDIQEFLKLNFK